MLLALNGSKSKVGPLFTHPNQKGANAFFLSTIVLLHSVLSQRRISQTKMIELTRLFQKKKDSSVKTQLLKIINYYVSNLFLETSC